MTENELFAMVGQKVRAFRQKSGLTQKEVAEKAQVHQSDLATFEKRGEKIKGLDIIARIVAATGHSMSDLFGEPAEKKTASTGSRLTSPLSPKAPPTTRQKTAFAG